jgi:hypothetical protein
MPIDASTLIVTLKELICSMALSQNPYTKTMFPLASAGAVHVNDSVVFPAPFVCVTA